VFYLRGLRAEYIENYSQLGLEPLPMFGTAADEESTPLERSAERSAAATLPGAASLNRFLSDAEPIEILRTARDVVGPQRLAVVSSFGIESAALLKLVADVDRAIPVLLLDTGWLFAETLTHRDAIVAKLGLTDVRSIKPDANALRRRDPDADLWSTDADACC